MQTKFYAGRFFALALLMVTAMGCADLALVGRPTLGPGAQRDLEFVGRVESLDADRREIRLQNELGRERIVRYDANTRVIIEGREHPVNRLQIGDLVAVQDDVRGDNYADIIRVRRRAEGRWPETARSPSALETIDGTVERVDYDRGTFELRERRGDNVLVSVPFSARLAEIDRFRSLRPGDRVRLEGRFLTQDRFQLEAFL